MDFDGVSAAILVASPFQINAQVPAQSRPAATSCTSPLHTARVQQTVTVAAVAPEIFLLGGASNPAVENSDGMQSEFDLSIQ